MKIGQYLIIKLIICWCNQKCLVTYQKSLEKFSRLFYLCWIAAAVYTEKLSPQAHVLLALGL